MFFCAKFFIILYILSNVVYLEVLKSSHELL